MSFFGNTMSSLASAGKSMLWNAGKGAAIGGVAGLMGGDGVGGFMGGAMAGGIAGAAMPSARRALGNRYGSLSGLASKGFGAIGAAGPRMTAIGSGLLANKALGGAGTMMGRAYGFASAGAVGAGRMMRSSAGAAQNYIGKNAIGINKWGGRALAGAGIASAGMIGGSLLSSNRGF